MTEVFKSSTSHSFYVELVDSTTGLPKTGILFSACTGSYVRAGAARAAVTMATLASASAAWSSGGFVEVDGTNMPGIYRWDIPDAAFATGVEEVVATLKATGCRTVSRGFTLSNWNKQVAAIPNAAASASGGLAVIGTGTNNFKSDASANVTAASVVGAVGSVTGNVGGNVVGSTASVTGAVGSVTGNVGGNVTGSVGSISGVTFPTGFSTLTVAAIQSGLATSANQTTIITHLTDIKGSGWVTGDNLHSRLDAAITSRMASFTYTAPDNTSITAIKAKTDNLPASPAQTSDVLSRLAASAYVAPDNASIGQVITNTEGIQTTLATAFPTNFADMRIDADGFAEVDAYAMEFSISGDTLTVKRADGTTTKYTKTLATDAGAVPIVGSA